jgi:hypothetical protein
MVPFGFDFERGPRFMCLFSLKLLHQLILMRGQVLLIRELPTIHPERKIVGMGITSSPGYTDIHPDAGVCCRTGTVLGLTFTQEQANSLSILIGPDDFVFGRFVAGQVDEVGRRQSDDLIVLQIGEMEFDLRFDYRWLGVKATVRALPGEPLALGEQTEIALAGAGRSVTEDAVIPQYAPPPAVMSPPPPVPIPAYQTAVSPSAVAALRIGALVLAGIAVLTALTPH